jgi:hypothetical protein
LLAAQEARTTRHLGAGVSHLAASAALGQGRPAFALGAAPAAEQEWPVRAPLLCAVLSAAVRAEATRLGKFVTAAEPAETERDCVAALLPSLSANAADPAESAALAAAP